jgi:hypothetical protein
MEILEREQGALRKSMMALIGDLFLMQSFGPFRGAPRRAWLCDTRRLVIEGGG